VSWQADEGGHSPQPYGVPLLSLIRVVVLLWCCPAAKPVQEEHAVVLVGYDNNQGFWIARNSWVSGALQADLCHAVQLDVVHS
jgi:hypothetical protein